MTLANAALLDGSLPALLLAELIDQHGLEETHRIIDELLDAFTNIELAAHEYDFRNVWARPKQLPPHDEWESFGNLAGRGVGKSLACSKLVNEEVEAGRAQLVCLIAQDEDSSIKLHVTGPSGLIATAPPWFKPTWHKSDLLLEWPNGARAYVRTPEVPGKIRGLEYHLAWCSELQSWPTATLEEAWMNVQISTRLGLARIVWDATAKRRHPLLTRLLKDAEERPHKNIVRRGSTYENALNLGKGYIEKIERRYGPETRAGQEELFARLFDDSEGATCEAAWIQARRVEYAPRLVRTAIGIDPAVTSRAGSDQTGIVIAGLDANGQAYVLDDRTDKHAPQAWAKIVLDEYAARKCDCVVVETNKGGQLLVETLRAAADKRKIEVKVLEKRERARHIQGIVYVREVYGRGEKADRAKPLGAAYEMGKISHVGVHKDLEEVLTTWIPAPGARSPDRLDAAVHVMGEILDLTADRPDPKRGLSGITQASAAVAGKARPAGRSIAAILGSGRRGGRI